MRAAIVGAGNFGTAIANIIANNGHCTHLWMRDAEQLADMRAHGENRRYLKGFPLERNVVPTCDMAAAVGVADIVFLTVPSASFRAVTREVAPHVRPGTLVVSGTKGVEAEGFHLMSQILDELLPQCVTGVISGPNLAEEIADKHYAGTVVASRSESLRDAVQTVLRSAEFPRLFQRGCLRRRVGRGAQEHLRHRLRHGVGARRGSEHRGHADHAQPGRNESLRGVARRQSRSPFSASRVSATCS